MKRFVFLFIVLMAALPVSAQYMPAEGLLTKKGTKIFAEGRKLTKGEIAATLSLVQDGKGVGYDVRWLRAKRTYNAGIALTTLGSIGIVTGGVTFSFGIVYLITLGIASPLYVVADDASGMDTLVVGAGSMMACGALCLCAGTAMLGAGIPLMCVFNSRMKKIVRGYNEHYDTTDKVTLNFGPTRNGIGLALNF